MNLVGDFDEMLGSSTISPTIMGMIGIAIFVLASQKGLKVLPTLSNGPRPELKTMKS